ncbi:hypothetical protein [Rothia nasimurium]|uniref:hypothetical protein n=1 Tax=Rothia nasimurium TaxID=85336 RepID=UPI001F361DA7|nr:hypothetical protein [Rothia nasimurium]
MFTFKTLEETFPGYRYPYGTDLTVADLVQNDGNLAPRLELTATFPDGTDHTYLLHVIPGTTLGEVLKDGQPWEFSLLGFEHPIRYDLDILEVEDRALQAQWFDAVLREHAAAYREAATQANPESTEKRYSGETLDSQLERIEKNIVSYDDRYVDLGCLRSLGGLKAWLTKHAPHQSAGWEFFTIDETRLPEVTGKNFLMFENMNTDADHGPDNPRVTYPPHAFRAGMTADDYTLMPSGQGELTDITPYLGFRLDGRTVTHFNSLAVLSYERVKDLLTPAREQDFLDGVWLAVRAVGLPMVLLIPPAGALLHLYIDEDGAMTVLEVCNWDYTVIDLFNTEMFNRRWGEYLDENRPVPADIIAQDITILHDLLEEGR